MSSLMNDPKTQKPEDLLNFLTPLNLFQSLEPASTLAVARELTRKSITGGETLFSQGEFGDAFYILTRGTLRVRIQSDAQAGMFEKNLKAGECIGEISLLTNQPRSATVTALEDSELLCLTKADFDRLAEAHPSLLTGLANQLLPRFLQDQTRAALKNFFGDIEDALLKDLLINLDCHRCRSGEILFQQGDPGDAMYIITQGRLRSVWKESDGSERILSEAGIGECVGEFALLAESGSPESLRTATVYATRLTDMIVITRPVFDRLLLEYPQVLIHLTRKIARRAIAVSKPQAATKSNTVIALLPLRLGQKLDGFVRELDGALSTLGSTLSLDAARFEELYGKKGVAATPTDHPLSTVINAWLDERERENDFSIYDVSPALSGSGHLTAWAERCLEDADLILLVGEADSDPRATEIEQALSSLKTCARLELVLTHPSDCPLPRGTAEWLRRREAGAFPVRAHHHVRVGNPADFRRLARRIVGKPIGLTLAGGSARGWAHLGVLRAMEESGLEFDWVAGASMGSIVAAGCALDWSSTQLSDLAARFSNSKQLLDYTFPYASFTATRRITNLLKELYAVDIEDTWRPFFCVSANLTQSCEIMHTRGPLWKAVRASMAFPGIFAPVMDEEGNVLIDGGAANNLPVDRMREVCPTGTVIGVDLVTGSSVSGKYHFDDSLSGWQALMGSIPSFPGTVKAPNLFSIVAGLVEGVCRYRLNEVGHSADLLIKVPVQPYGLLDFDKYAEIIETGYHAAQEQLKGFRVV
jgi:predicted acylesterase/phospholipase RssA/CRP-like cAMP-binding protein